MAAVVAFDRPAAAAGAAAAAGGAAACTAAAGAGAAGGAGLGAVAGSAADSVSPAAAPIGRCQEIVLEVNMAPATSGEFRNSWLCRNEEACIARATAGGRGARVRRKRKEFE